MTNETATGPGDPTPLRRVQRAAVRRALTDPADAARYLAFAGALDTANRSVERSPIPSDSGGADLADALIASVFVHFGVDRTISDDPGEASARTDRAERGARSEPPTPTAAPTPNLGGRPDPLAVGAAIAHVTFDVDVERAAALAGTSTDAVHRAIAEIE